MVFILYHQNAYQEYLLPQEDNIDYTVRLDSAALCLRLERRDGAWRLHAADGYTLQYAGAQTACHTLQNGDIIHVRTAGGQQLQAIVAEAEPVMPVLHKLTLDRQRPVTIGSAGGNTLRYSFKTLVSKQHATLAWNGGWTIRDHSTNGIFLNGVKIREHRLAFGETVNIFGLQLVYLGDRLAVGTSYGDLDMAACRLAGYAPPFSAGVARAPAQEPYNRAPRVLPPIQTEKVTIEEPPPNTTTRKKPLLLTIGPALTMALPMLLGTGLAIYSTSLSGGSASAFMYTGIITAVGSALLGVLWTVMNLRHTKQQEREDEQQRFNAYGNYLLRIGEHLAGCYKGNSEALHLMYPPAANCCTYHSTGTALWGRNASHEDFLYHRLGLGDLPFQVEIEIPRAKFALEPDALAQKPAMLREEYGTLKGVPVGIDLATHRLVGVVGQPPATRQVVYSLLAQLAANNCYTDVKIAFAGELADAAEREAWDFVRWLPHTWSQDFSTRYVATDALEAADVFFELGNVLRRRAEAAEGTPGKASRPKPWYVLFVLDAALLEGELLAKYVYDPREEYGLTTVVVAPDAACLPNACEDIIQNGGGFTGFYNAVEQSAPRRRVQFDGVDIVALRRFARGLAGVRVREFENDGELPATLDFMEMLGVHGLDDLHVGDMWRKNRIYNSMRAPVGRKAGGALMYLDIHEKYHGPHGLVAGTTGSGKSELLQTFILSLAMQFSPDDVAFLLIDFKGGGMANLFDSLPHMAGKITNLSGNQKRRAMISIKSENLRRQRLFSEHSVNSINQYTRLYKNGEAAQPVPHLVIVIDEFAELKKEEPDFMQELISVAQVGRSLGVHLVLATQKPGGNVDDNIRSNAKFRLCLRVQDRQDSLDMLQKPDAAYITQAGRCYIQVGSDEIYELVQTGYSGAPYDAQAAGAKSETATLLTATGKAALVGSNAQRRRKEVARLAWHTAVAGAALQALAPTGLAPDALPGLVEETARQLEAAGLPYGESRGERTRLKNFLALWPEGETDAGAAAAHIAAEAAAGSVAIPEPNEKSQLAAIVELLAGQAAQDGYQPSRGLWLPELPESLVLERVQADRFDGAAWPAPEPVFALRATLGLYDDPVNQAQGPYTVDLAEGHLAVIGGVVSGKSTLLQTLVYSLAQRYTPEALHLYLLDFSSQLLAPFAALPHVGGVILENDEARTGHFFKMMRAELARRKALLGGGSFAQYRRGGGKLAAAVVVIDGFAGFNEKTGSRFEEDLIALAREGVGYGIYLVASAAGFGMAEIPGRIGDNMRTVVCLELGDKFKFMEAPRAPHLPVLPEPDVRGRGLASIGGAHLEFQAALACEAGDDYLRGAALQQACEAMAGAWHGPAAPAVPEIPQKPALYQLAALPACGEALQTAHLLPFGWRQEDAALYSLDLRHTWCYTVLGRPRTGKNNALRVLLHMAAGREGGQLCVVEKGQTRLKSAATAAGAEYIDTDEALYQYMRRLLDTFAARNKHKQALAAEGAEEEGIFAAMARKFPPVYIFIADLAAFMQMVYRPAEGVPGMSGFVENMVEKGALHNIYLFAALEPDAAPALAGYKAGAAFTGYKTGMLLGGNPQGQRMFTFSNVHFNELGKALKPGLGLTPDEEDDSMAVRVVLPQAGRMADG